MSETEVALVVGGGPGISASCVPLFSQEGMKVAVAARNVDKAGGSQHRRAAKRRISQVDHRGRQYGAS